VKLLLDKGAKLETKDTRYGQTPLWWAAEKGHEAVVKLLLNKGAEVGIENRGGWTALQLAALNRHEGLE
jgi:ankyrin repeat protein